MNNVKVLLITLFFSISVFGYSFGLNQNFLHMDKADEKLLPDKIEYNGFIAENSTALLEADHTGDSRPITTMVNDPYYPKQWSLQEYYLPITLEHLSEQPVTVAILDTGIDKYHEDLTGKVLQEIDMTGVNSPTDIKGHGTHIAGIISANKNNNIGICGIASDCYLLNVKVTDNNGRCNAATLAEGIIWAADNGAKVINISITINEPYLKLEEAVNYAWDKGCIIIAAASNETVDPVYPAGYEHCLPVVAVNTENQITPLQYKNDWIQIAAPGCDIYSTLPGDKYGYWKGTSFAAAHVSGIAAMLFTCAEDCNGDGNINDEIRTAIEKGSVESPDDKFKRINIGNSISLLSCFN